MSTFTNVSICTVLLLGLLLALVSIIDTVEGFKCWTKLSTEAKTEIKDCPVSVSSCASWHCRKPDGIIVPFLACAKCKDDIKCIYPLGSRMQNCVDCGTELCNAPPTTPTTTTTSTPTTTTTTTTPTTTTTTTTPTTTTTTTTTSTTNADNDNDDDDNADNDNNAKQRATLTLSLFLLVTATIGLVMICAAPNMNLVGNHTHLCDLVV